MTDYEQIFMQHAGRDQKLFNPEMLILLKKHGYPEATPEMVKGLYAKFDATKDGHIDLAEWNLMIKDLPNLK